MDTRVKILRAALKASSKKGLDSLSMDEVALEAGIKKASLYYYYPSKDILKKKMLERYVPGKEFTASIDFRSKTEDILTAVVLAYGKECVKGENSHIFRIMESARFYDKDVKVAYIKQEERRDRAVKSILKTIEKRKVVRFEDFETASRFYSDLIHLHIIRLLDAKKDAEGELSPLIEGFSRAFLRKGVAD